MRDHAIVRLPDPFVCELRAHLVLTLPLATLYAPTSHKTRTHLAPNSYPRRHHLPPQPPRAPESAVLCGRRARADDPAARGAPGRERAGHRRGVAGQRARPAGVHGVPPVRGAAARGARVDAWVLRAGGVAQGYDAVEGKEQGAGVRG
jgi:hypothetical protein